MAFTVIEPTPGLSVRDRRRAHRAGPVAVAVRTGYASLLASARFRLIEAIDVTAEYAETQRLRAELFQREEAGLRAVFNDAEYEERRRSQRLARAAIEDGLLSRFVYSTVTT
jgi:hypothetical protein